MKLKQKIGIIVALLIFFFTPFVFSQDAQQLAPEKPSPLVHINLLQMNDIYEMTPMLNGTQGGLARVSTLKKELQRHNPNTFTILAGDLFSPSALGTAKVLNEQTGQREALAGKQMVDVMNHLGLDFATFGNHEFDLKEKQFYQRLSESQTTWISSNVLDKSGRSFPNVQSSHIFTVRGQNNKQVKVGIFGLTINSNPKPYVQYQDVMESAKAQVAGLRPYVDILIAITHLPYPNDIQLVEAYPQIDLILGGHEHENMEFHRGLDFTPITKADANARSVYLHELIYNTETRQLASSNRLLPITDQIIEDEQVANVVKKWVNVAYQGFEADGFQPREQIAQAKVPLDGREASVRNGKTILTQVIGTAMLNAATGSELALFNAGSIRLDDTLPPGPVSQYDVLRILPFPGKVLGVEIQGSLLKEVLDAGENNRGTGGYLQTLNVTSKEGQWFIQNKVLEPERIYSIAINDFLMEGKESNLSFLKFQEPYPRLIQSHGDIRQALIAQLKRESGQ